MHTLNTAFDSRGHLHVGPYSRNSDAKVTIDLSGADAGLAIDVKAPDLTTSRRASIKLGDFTIGQDTAANGTKDFGILDANGVVIQSLSAGVPVNGGVVPNKHGRSDLFSTGIPLIILPSGSIADNGVLTSGTANPLTYLKTFCWYPAASIVASGAGSAAGWYYTVFTTTTAGIVYNNTWDGASDPAIPASPTAFVTTGPGAFTGPTTNAAYMSFPMAAATVNARYEVKMKFNQTNNANAKTVTARMTNVGGTLFWTNTTTSFAESEGDHVIRLLGVADKQEVFGKTLNATAFVRQATALASETTSAAWVLAICASKGTATDVAVIEAILITLVV